MRCHQAHDRDQASLSCRCWVNLIHNATCRSKTRAAPRSQKEGDNALKYFVVVLSTRIHMSRLQQIRGFRRMLPRIALDLGCLKQDDTVVSNRTLSSIGVETMVSLPRRRLGPFLHANDVVRSTGIEVKHVVSLIVADTNGLQNEHEICSGPSSRRVFVSWRRGYARVRRKGWQRRY